jgi:hypothetical protein
MGWSVAALNIIELSRPIAFFARLSLRPSYSHGGVLQHHAASLLNKQPDVVAQSSPAGKRHNRNMSAGIIARPQPSSCSALRGIQR